MDHRIIEQIEALFANPSAFAKLAASIEVEQYRPEQFDFYQYPLGVYWIGIERRQVKSVRQAFAALFILDLYYQNDWICGEAFRTNAEQRVIEKMRRDEWGHLLRNQWIEGYFALKQRRLRVKNRDAEQFRRELLWWMPENAGKERAGELEQILQRTDWVCSLFPDAFYDQFFGATDAYYFFAESGVYD